MKEEKKSERRDTWYGYTSTRKSLKKLEGRKQKDKKEEKSIATTRRLTTHWLPAWLLPTAQHLRENTHSPIPIHSPLLHRHAPLCQNPSSHAILLCYYYNHHCHYHHLHHHHHRHRRRHRHRHPLHTRSSSAFTDRNRVIHFAKHRTPYATYLCLLTRYSVTRQISIFPISTYESTQCYSLPLRTVKEALPSTIV